MTIWTPSFDGVTTREKSVMTQLNKEFNDSRKSITT